MNNKKGQVIIFRIMMAIIVFIAVVLISPAVKQIVDGAYTSTDMNCNGAALSPAQIATCVVLDEFIFFFLGSCAAVGIAFLAGQKNITGVLSAITIFIITIVLITPLKQFIVYIRDSDHLVCSAANMSLGNKMACIFFDAWLFWFLATIVAIVLTYLFAKEVLPQ